MKFLRGVRNKEKNEQKSCDHGGGRWRYYN